MKKQLKQYIENIKGEDKKKYGIMGGTFDPIHLGHLFIAETSRQELDLNKIIFIPAGDPPHKKNRKITDAYHRLSMTNIAINDNKSFMLSNIEINRGGYSYTVETIKKLLKCYGETTELYFITGTDAFMEMETWKDYKQLFAMVRVVVATRLGYNDISFNAKIQSFKKKYNAKIIKLPIPVLEISSSDIRNRVKKKKSIKYLVTEGVEQYIYKHQLYIK